MSNKTLCTLHLPVCLRRYDAVLIRAVLPEYHPKIAWCNDRLSEADAVAAGIEEVVTIELHCAGGLYRLPVLCSSPSNQGRWTVATAKAVLSYLDSQHSRWSRIMGLESPIRHVTSRRHGKVIVRMPAFGRSIDLWSRTLGPRRKLSQMTILLEGKSVAKVKRCRR